MSPYKFHRSEHIPSVDSKWRYFV